VASLQGKPPRACHRSCRPDPPPALTARLHALSEHAIDSCAAWKTSTATSSLSKRVTLQRASRERPARYARTDAGVLRGVIRFDHDRAAPISGPRRRRASEGPTIHHVATAGRSRRLVEHVRDAALHARRNVAPGTRTSTRTHDAPPLMYSQQWSPTTLDTGTAPGVAHRKRLAGEGHGDGARPADLHRYDARVRGKNPSRALAAPRVWPIPSDGGRTAMTPPDRPLPRHRSLASPAQADVSTGASQPPSSAGRPSSRRRSSSPGQPRRLCALSDPAREDAPTQRLR